MYLFVCGSVVFLFLWNTCYCELRAMAFQKWKIWEFYIQLTYPHFYTYFFPVKFIIKTCLQMLSKISEINISHKMWILSFNSFHLRVVSETNLCSELQIAAFLWKSILRSFHGITTGYCCVTKLIRLDSSDV